MRILKNQMKKKTVFLDIDGTLSEYRYDDNLVTIINEEAISYQNDRKSIDTVINNIINRSEIYLKEKDNFK